MSSQKPGVPRWMLKLQIALGIFLIVIAVFLYYAVVPKGLDQTVAFVLLGFGILNLFFGRFLFVLPEKQQARAKMLKEEKEREKRKEAKQRAKQNKESKNNK